ncbi:MAG: hypothetical protein AAF798_00780 [Bacteroidota bacterium]
MYPNYLLLLFTSLLFLGSCSNTSAPQKAVDQAFKTTPPSRIYFKNIRSASYSTLDNEREGMDLYRLRKYEQPAKAFRIVPTIADYWLNDQAYILFQFENPDTLALTTPLEIQWESSGQENGSVQLTPMNQKGQHAFAKNLYELLQQKHQLFLALEDNKRVKIFDNHQELSYIMTVLRDYFKLTEAI